MTARTLHALGALAWGVLVAATLLWWAPTLLLVLARWQGGRVRFEAVMALGLPGVASRVYAAEAARREGRRRALHARRE